MKIDGLVQHEPAVAAAKHRPTPFIVSVIDDKSELLVESDAGGHALDGLHWDKTIDLHDASLVGVPAGAGGNADSGAELLDGQGVALAAVGRSAAPVFSSEPLGRIPVVSVTSGQPDGVPSAPGVLGAIHEE